MTESKTWTCSWTISSIQEMSSRRNSITIDLLLEGNLKYVFKPTKRGALLFILLVMRQDIKQFSQQNLREEMVMDEDLSLYQFKLISIRLMKIKPGKVPRLFQQCHSRWVRCDFCWNMDIAVIWSLNAAWWRFFSEIVELRYWRHDRRVAHWEWCFWQKRVLSSK